MKLTSSEALELIENTEQKYVDSGWLLHSKCVGDTAGIIAKALALDEDKAKALGYIHDIGKSVGSFEEHSVNGYEYLKNLGYDDEYADVCLIHSALNNDINCSACHFDYKSKYYEDYIKNHKYTIYEKIIILCDLMCAKKVMTVDERLIDVIIRHGVNENTVYFLKEAKKLKEEFDNMLGRNIYEIIPNIYNG